MEKYFITDFKKIYADIILHNQKELNPDGNECIEGEEVEKVKEFFNKRYGIKDISEMLANQDENEETANVDIVKITNKAEETGEAPEEINETGEEDGEPEETGDNDIPEEIARVKKFFDDTAFDDISRIIDNDLAMSGIKDPNAEAVSNMEQARAYADSKGDANASEDYDVKIGVLEAMSYLQAEIKPEDMEDENYKEVQVGKNKIYIAQSLNLGTNSKIPKKDDDDFTEIAENDDDQTESDESTDGQTDSYDTDPSKETNIDFNYNFKFYTKNPETKGNTAGFLTVNGGSTDFDIFGKVNHFRTAKNGTINSIGFVGRKTIKGKEGNEDVGLSYDMYNEKRKIGTGIYGQYSHKDEYGDDTKTFKSESYLKYANTLRVTAGYEKEDDTKTFSTDVALRGKREFSKSGIKIAGKVQGEYGISRMDDIEAPMHRYGINASGYISFRGSKDFQADVVGNFLYLNQSLNTDEMSVSQNAIGASLLTKISTKDIDLSANVSAVKTPYNATYLGVSYDSDSKTAVTANVEFVPKKLLSSLGLGNDVELGGRYTIGNYEGATHQLGFFCRYKLNNKQK